MENNGQWYSGRGEFEGFADWLGKEESRIFSGVL